MPRTNVLLIQTDQWNPRALGCLGHPDARTPNIDSLAAQGSLFANHYCNHPLCLPSRISLLSGQYCGTHRQYGFAGLLDRRTPLIHEAFRQAGYRTGASGKFHVHSIAPEQWTLDFAAPTLLNEIDMARPAGNHYMGYCDARGVPCPNDQQHCGNPWGRKKPLSSHATEDMFWMHRESVKSDVPLEHSLEVYTADRCLEFLGGSGDGRPFFYWLTFDRPHHPTTLPEPWFSKVNPDSLHLPALPDERQLAAMPPSMFQDYARHCSRFNMGEKALRFVVATYFVLLEFIDQQIGRVLERLRQSGRDADTTIVFTADHGDEAGQRGVYEKFLGVSSEEICRCPLIIRPAPSLAPRSAGQVFREPVESVDVFPTLCSLAGVPGSRGLEGADLSGAVLARSGSQALDASRAVFTEEIQSRSVVRNGWKLVYDILHDERQLYDLARDPWCFENLYSQDRHAAGRMELKRLLLGFLMQRLHGPFTREDVEHVLRAVDPACPEVGLHISPMVETNNHRAACTIRGAEHELLVPFFDQMPMMLWPRKRAAGRFGFRKKDEAVTDDAQAERLLDAALDRAFAGMHGLSNTRNWPKCEYAQPSPAAARELVERYRAGMSARGGAIPGSAKTRTASKTAGG